MLEADGKVVTDDMTLAVVLILNGYHPAMDRLGQQVVWVVEEEDVDEDTHQLLDEYTRGALRVEPRRMTRMLSDVRKDMYEYMGLSNKPRGARIVRRAVQP